MGSWFSNLHIRRAENIEPSAVDSALTEMMTAANYLPAENAGGGRRRSRNTRHEFGVDIRIFGFL